MVVRPVIDGLDKVLGATFGSGTAAAELTRLSGGASREMWSLDAVSTSGERVPLILRLDSPGLSDVNASGGLPSEAALMRAAASSGVPVPEVIASGEEFLDRPYVLMGRVDGETIPRRILRDEVFAEVRPRLATQCGEVLAALHRMPRDVVPDAPEDPLESWRAILDACEEPHPVFELALRRLDGSRPPAGRVTVVHGDFRNGNLIIGPNGIRAVLDWELSHAGDPIEDLGWLCVKAWRFGSPLPVGGFGTYDDLISAYERASGFAVDRQALRWWETFGVLKWGIICIMQTLRHVRGGARSVELAAVGRRVCENEWDLLDLLEAR